MYLSCFLHSACKANARQIEKPTMRRLCIYRSHSSDVSNSAENALYPKNPIDPLLKNFAGSKFIGISSWLSSAKNVPSIDYFSRMRILTYCKQKIGKRNDFMQVLDCLIQKCHSSKDGKRVHFASMKIPLSHEENLATACGIAGSAKEAEACAYMHAEDILEEFDLPVYENAARQEQYSAERMRQGRKITSTEKRKQTTDGPTSPVITYLHYSDSSERIPDATSLRLSAANSPACTVPQGQSGSWAFEKSMALYFNPENFLKKTFAGEKKKLVTNIESRPAGNSTDWTVHLGYKQESDVTEEINWILNATGKIKLATLRYASIRALMLLHKSSIMEHASFFKYFLDAIEVDKIQVSISKANPGEETKDDEDTNYSKVDVRTKEMYQGEVRFIQRSTAASESMFYIVDAGVLNMSCRSRMDLWFLLRRQGRPLGEMIRYFKVAEGGLNKSNIFQAEIRLPLPEAVFGERLAIGIAHRKKDAAFAAVQHAELILDAIGVPVLPIWPYYADKGGAIGTKANYRTQHAQDIRAVKTRARNRWAPSTRDYIRPSAPSPPPLFVKPDEVEDGLCVSHFSNVTELGPCHRVKVQTTLQRIGATCKISKNTIVFSKTLMHVGVIILSLPYAYGGQKVAQGIARSSSKAVHIAFTNALQILEAYGVTEQLPKHCAKTPPPLILVDAEIDSYRAPMKTGFEPFIEAPAESKIRELFKADTQDGYIMVKEQETKKNEIISRAISDPRIADPYSTIRIRAFYRALTKTIHSELPIEFEECRGGTVYFKRGKFTLHLPKPFPQILICAEARTKKEVQILCSMQLELQLDAIGFPINSTKATQYTHAIACRHCGRDAPTDIDVKQPTKGYIIVPPLRKDYGREVSELMLEASVLSHDESIDANIRYGSSSKVINFQEINRKFINWGDSTLAHALETYLGYHSQSIHGNTEISHEASSFVIKCQVPYKNHEENDVATGMSTINREAVSLCHLHFALILHARKISIFADYDKQKAHAARMNQLISSIGCQSNAHTSTEVPRGLRVEPPGKPVAPNINRYKIDFLHVWYEFCQRCEAYISESFTYKNSLNCYQPKSGDPIIDEAREASEKKDIDGSSKMILNSFCTRIGIPLPEPKVSVTEIRGMRKFVTTIQLQGFSWMSTGVDSNQKVAEVRATMHCIEILRRTHPEFDCESDLSSRMRRMSELELLMSNVDGGCERILDIYASCGGIQPAKMSTRYTGDGISATIILEDHERRYEGTAVYGKRCIAEQMARESLCKRLQHVPRFMALGKLFSKHPKLHLKHLFSLDGIEKLPEIEELSVLSRKLECNAGETSAEETQMKARKIYKTPVYSCVIGKSSADVAQRRASLPIAAYKDIVLKQVKAASVLILCGTTGSGKTTQVPQFILEDSCQQGDAVNIVVSIPRRISAISVARHVAFERGQSAGMSVGYSVRFEHSVGSHLNFVTTGVLLRLLAGNPLLTGVSHVIIDEVHERDLNTDFLLLLMKRLLLLRPDLKVIIMSATLESELFASYFGSAPIINVNHAAHAVHEMYLDDIAKLATQSPSAWVRQKGILLEQQLSRENNMINSELHVSKESNNHIKSDCIDFRLILFLVHHCIEKHELLSLGGSILIFLPGWYEIRKAREVLEQADDSWAYDIRVLHSGVSPEEQMRCFAPPRKNRVKIVLATNIAESGITIDDVVCVIDTGLLKEKHTTNQLDDRLSSAITSLVTVHASKASCMQRQGRAGRVRQGYCYKLFSRLRYSLFKNFRHPEILRLSLEGICLSILDQGLGSPVDVLQSAISVPKARKVEAAIEMLKYIGAVSPSGTLTKLGKQIARIPASPKIAKMLIIGCRLNCLDLALTLAASTDIKLFKLSNDMNVQDITVARDLLSDGQLSDQYCLVSAYNRYCDAWDDDERRKRFIQEFNIDEQALYSMSKIKKQLYDELVSMKLIDIDDAHEIACQGRSKAERMRKLGPTSRPFVECTRYSLRSHSMALFHGLVSVVCSGNVGVQREKGLYSSRLNEKLKLMPGSVISNQLAYSPFIVFSEKLDRKILNKGPADVSGEMREATVVDVWTLLLFGVSTEQLDYWQDLNLCILDKWLIFKVSRQEYSKLMMLRKAFDTNLQLNHHQDKRVQRGLSSALVATLQKLCKVEASK